MGPLRHLRATIYKLFVAPKALQASGVSLSAFRWSVLACDFALAIYVFFLTLSLLLLALDVPLDVGRGILET